MTVALSWGRSHGAWLRAPAADGDAASRAVRAVLELPRRPVLAAPLGSSLHLLPPTFSSADVPGLGKVTLATFAEKVDAAKARHDTSGARSPLGVAWAVHDGELLAAAGEGAPQLLASAGAGAAGGASPGTLGDDPRSARALSALGADVTFALLAQPLRLDPARGDAGGAAPTVLAWGRRDGSAWAHVDLADALIRELVRLGAGF
jgi:hypothetical protein